MAHQYSYKQIRGAISACKHKIRVEPSNILKTIYQDRLKVWQRRLREYER